MTNIKKYQSEKIITRKMVKYAPFDDIYFIWSLVSGIAMFITALTIAIIGIHSPWWLLELAPPTALFFLNGRRYQKGLNEIYQRGTNYRTVEKPFKYKDGMRMMLRMPINKSLDCGLKQKKSKGKVLIGVQHTEIQSIKGKLMLVKNFQQDVSYRWEETFQLAIRGNKS